ncbi:unnamed protein product, partial [Ectocarpus sp. 8 AP-2014]
VTDVCDVSGLDVAPLPPHEPRQHRRHAAGEDTLGGGRRSSSSSSSSTPSSALLAALVAAAVHHRRVVVTAPSPRSSPEKKRRRGEKRRQIMRARGSRAAKQRFRRGRTHSSPSRPSWRFPGKVCSSSYSARVSKSGRKEIVCS